MIKSPLFVRYYTYTNTIKFSISVGSAIINHFAGAINAMKRQNEVKRSVVLDFSVVQRAYSSGMLAIIASIKKLREDGYNFEIILPKDKNIARLFIYTNWAHYLDPILHPAFTGNGRHLQTRNFNEDVDISVLTNDFMDVVLRTMYIPKDVLSGLEWSVYEICDNVLNHGSANFGGYIEAFTFLKEEKICFTVADGGKGILNSLKEGFPNLENCSTAIQEALKPGITRNKSAGQGNGLAGSSRITTMTGGSIDITSGTGRVIQTAESLTSLETEDNFLFEGTSVSGSICMKKGFSIGEALVFNGNAYFPTNVIELQYEHPVEDLFVLALKNEPTGVGTRKAGKQMQTKVMNLTNANPQYPIHVDWAGIDIIASSFADEFIGKLYWLIGRDQFLSKIRNINLQPLVEQLLGKAIEQRGGELQFLQQP